MGLFTFRLMTYMFITSKQYIILSCLEKQFTMCKVACTLQSTMFFLHILKIVVPVHHIFVP